MRSRQQEWRPWGSHTQREGEPGGVPAGWSPGSSAARGCAEKPGRVGRAAAGGATALGPPWEGAAAASGADDGGRPGSLEPLEEPSPEEPGLGEPGPEGPAGGEVWGLPAAVRPWGAGWYEAGENGSDPNSDLMAGPAGLPDGDGRKTGRGRPKASARAPTSGSLSGREVGEQRQPRARVWGSWRDLGFLAGLRASRDLGGLVGFVGPGGMWGSGGIWVAWRGPGGAEHQVPTPCWGSTGRSGPEASPEASSG